MKTRIILALLGAVTVAAPLISPVAFAQDDSTTYKQTWKGVATLRTLQKEGKKLDLSAQYPVFSGSRPVAQVAGLVLKNDAIKGYNAAVKNAAATPMPDGMKYEFQFNPRLVLNRPRLISAQTLYYEFTGGAHGMYATSGYVFGYPSGATKPRTLHLADFFTTVPTVTRKRVNDLLMAKLRADDRAMWVADKTVNSVTSIQMENFVAEPNGLRWVFGPYEMGPYANGEIEVKLTSRELGPTFRAAMLR